MAEPSPKDFIDVARLAIQGQADLAADFVEGSDYEAITGPAAMLWAREALRDADMFSAVRLHTAQGDDLTDRVKAQFNIDRILDTRGQGNATLVRPSAGSGGTIWAGTRLTVLGSQNRSYRVTADKPVTPLDTVVQVDVEAVDIGPGSAISRRDDIQLDDELWDASWTVAQLECADGTVYEPAATLIARVREGRRDSRPGHIKEIERVCKEVGAYNVAIYRSDFGNPTVDGGLNVCYVGDLGYSSTPALVKACFLALRSARVLGAHMQVLPMQRANLSVSADVTLRTQPQNLNVERLSRLHREAIRQHLGGASGGFSYSLSGIRGAIIRPSADVQDVSLVSPSSDAGVLIGGSFPAVLNRYVVSNIDLRYRGP